MSGADLQQVINDSCAEVNSSSSDFWIMVAALKVGETKIASMISLNSVFDSNILNMYFLFPC